MQNVCLIFDIGRTNKKLFLFDEHLAVVHEESEKINPTTDEDGNPCEDLNALTQWISQRFNYFKQSNLYNIIAVNSSAYAASWVHLDKDHKVVSPLYSTNKKIPYHIKEEFKNKHNHSGDLFIDTASPDMGMLNAGLQLYWLKHQKPDIFKQVKHSIPLAQYCQFLIHGSTKVGLASIGCHSALWDFNQKKYHHWITDEKLNHLLVEPTSNSTTLEIGGIQAGIGIHNSSAALVPYLSTQESPFILLSTGVWTITFNPFCTEKVNSNQLKKDALNYIRFDGDMVKGSRLFSGDEHKRVSKLLSEHFAKPLRWYRKMRFDPILVQNLRKNHTQFRPENTEIGSYLDCPFMDRNITDFSSYEEAYHQFMMDLVAQQILSIKLTFGKEIPQYVYVDGGFAENKIFMNLLDEAFFNKRVFANKTGQASALGAALVIKNAWTRQDLKLSHLKLKKY